MAMGPASKLTQKESRFAAALASGVGQAQAYRLVYSSRAGNRAAQANGRQVAMRARVKAEVERLRRYPSPDNFAGIREYAIAKLIDMAESDLNPAVRHRALTTLLEHGGKGLQHPPPARQAAAVLRRKEDIDAILDDMRCLYQKELAIETVRPGIEETDPPPSNLLSKENVTPQPDNTDPLESETESILASDGGDEDYDSGSRGDVEEPCLACRPSLPKKGDKTAFRHSVETAYFETAGIAEVARWSSESIRETEGSASVAAGESGLQESTEEPQYVMLPVPGRFPKVMRRVLIKNRY
jgi:hypothetical protein